MKLIELTQRTNDCDSKPVFVNPEFITSLYRIKEDGTGLTIHGSYNTAVYVNESIRYVAAVLQGKTLPKPSKIRTRKRKG
jgi:hypothetical protein